MLDECAVDMGASFIRLRVPLHTEVSMPLYRFNDSIGSFGFDFKSFRETIDRLMMTGGYPV